MKPKTFIAAAIASALLSIPIAAAFSKQTNRLQIEKSSNLQYQLRIENIKVKAKAAEEQTEKLKKQNDDLQKQLQSKKEAQAKVAAAQAAAPAVVASAPVAGPGTCIGYASLISQYSWPVNVALAVCAAESRGVAVANNPTDDHVICLGSRGLFQIGCDSTGNFAGMFDPAANVAQAYALYVHRGFQPWTTYTRGTYLSFLQ